MTFFRLTFRQLLAFSYTLNSPLQILRTQFVSKRSDDPTIEFQGRLSLLTVFLADPWTYPFLAFLHHRTNNVAEIKGGRGVARTPESGDQKGGWSLLLKRGETAWPCRWLRLRKIASVRCMGAFLAQAHRTNCRALSRLLAPQTPSRVLDVVLERTFEHCVSPSPKGDRRDSRRALHPSRNRSGQPIHLLRKGKTSKLGRMIGTDLRTVRIAIAT